MKVKIYTKVDLTPTGHIDDDGLYLANHESKYANINNGFDPKITDNTYHKVNGVPTLNQVLNKRQTDTLKETKDTINKLKKNLENIDNIVGKGVQTTTHRIVNLGYNLEQLKEIWRLERFVNDNPLTRNNPPHRNPAGNTNLINKIKEKYFLVQQDKFKNDKFKNDYIIQYNQNNNLNMRKQKNNNSDYQFNESTMDKMFTSHLDDYDNNDYDEYKQIDYDFNLQTSSIRKLKLEVVNIYNENDIAISHTDKDKDLSRIKITFQNDKINIEVFDDENKKINPIPNFNY